MPKYSAVAWERAMKVQEVILRAMAKKITWCQAAEIIELSSSSAEPLIRPVSKAMRAPGLRLDDM
jgi:hypothetical protein